MGLFQGLYGPLNLNIIDKNYAESNFWILLVLKRKVLYKYWKKFAYDGHNLYASAPA